MTSKKTAGEVEETYYVGKEALVNHRGAQCGRCALLPSDCSLGRLFGHLGKDRSPIKGYNRTSQLIAHVDCLRQFSININRIPRKPVSVVSYL